MMSGSWDNNDPNSIIPENTAPDVASMDGTRGTGFDNQKDLTADQMDWLLKRVSTEDQEELGKILKNCTFEMTMTKGLPFAGLVTGSMWLARSRLPEKYRFGPKGWPFYALVGFGAMTTANMLSMNTCGERVKPKIWELYHKYNANTNIPANATSYDALRAKNRQNLSDQPNQAYPAPYPVQDQPPRDQYPQPPRDQYPQPPRGRPASGYLYEDPPPVMSGTPYDNYPPQASGEPRGPPTDSYGDKGFSKG